MSKPFQLIVAFAFLHLPAQAISIENLGNTKIAHERAVQEIKKNEAFFVKLNKDIHAQIPNTAGPRRDKLENSHRILTDLLIGKNLDGLYELVSLVELLYASLDDAPALATREDSFAAYSQLNYLLPVLLADLVRGEGFEISDQKLDTVVRYSWTSPIRNDERYTTDDDWILFIGGERTVNCLRTKYPKLLVSFYDELATEKLGRISSPRSAVGQIPKQDQPTPEQSRRYELAFTKLETLAKEQKAMDLKKSASGNGEGQPGHRNTLRHD